MTITDDSPHPGSQSPTQPPRKGGKYRFPHMVEFQTSAPHTGQEGQDENTVKEGRLGSLASSRHEPASHLPQVTSSLAGTWRSSAEYSLPPGIQGRGGHLPDGVPYKGDTKQWEMAGASEKVEPPGETISKASMGLGETVDTEEVGSAQGKALG